MSCRIVFFLTSHGFRNQTQVVSQTWYKHLLSPHWVPNKFCVILFSSFIVLITLSSLDLQLFSDSLRWSVFALSTISCVGRVGTTMVFILDLHTLYHALLFQCLSEAGGLWWATAC